MGLSVNEFTYTGDNTFDLNFAGGYAKQSDVSCARKGLNPIVVSFNWLTNDRVQIVPTDLKVGDTLAFYRTVSKSSLPLDLNQPGTITRGDIDTGLRHTMYMMHEVLDGRTAAFGDVSEITANSVAEVIQRAFEETDLIIEKRYPVVIHGPTTGPILHVSPVILKTSIEEVTFSIESYPTVDTVLDIESAGVSVFQIRLFADGTHLITTTSGSDQFVIQKGSLKLFAENGQYFDSEIAVGINGVDSEIITTTEDFTDFLAAYTNARDAV